MDNREIEQEKTEESAKQDAFYEWLKSLKDYELLDLMMTCGFLLGKRIGAPVPAATPKVEDDDVETDRE